MKVLTRVAALFRRSTAESLGRVAGDDLSRLDELEAGLGAKAVDYVLHARQATCLASIHTRATARTLGVLSRQHDIRSPTNRRRLVLLGCGSDHADFVRRYAEVLGAATGDELDDAPGSDAVPALARVLFGELFLLVASGRLGDEGQKELAAGQGFGLDTASGFAEHLGCTRVDMIDLLYTEGRSWSKVGGGAWRRLVEVRPLLAGAPGELVVAAARMPSAAREALMGDLARLELASTPTALDFLLDQCGDSAKGARQAAVNALRSVSPGTLEPLAIRRLATGKVGVRAAMVELLAGIGTPSALEALGAHARTEKTARVVSAIDTALAVEKIRQGDSGVDDASGYVALGGTRIDIPVTAPPDETDPPVFGDADVAELRALIDAENARRKQRDKANAGRKHYSRAIPLDPSIARKLVALCNAPSSASASIGVSAHDLERHFRPWFAAALARLPDAVALRLCLRLDPASLVDFVYPYRAARSTSGRVLAFLNGPDGDLRHLQDLLVAAGATVRFGGHRDRTERARRPGDALAGWLVNTYGAPFDTLAELPREVVWPYVATHLHVLDEAFGLTASERGGFDRLQTLAALRLLPAMPARFLGPLLEIATGPSRTGREEARRMLAGAPGIDARFVTLLDDTRQAVRAGAAEWLGRRGDASAADALEARLKKERSELARAAILTALGKLGRDVATHVGPEALAKEAAKGLKSAKLGKLAWLNLDHLPKVAYRHGDPVPDDVLRYWVHLAVKLKQPGGNALFGIYLDRLEPADAETLSTWVLDSWIDHDTARASDEEANAHAATHAPARLKQYLRWYPDYTLEQAVASLKAEIKGQYLNSGAATKGLLALAEKAPPALVADRVRSYLKSHGSRTSQASALLELAAAHAHPATLQVVIAAATRLRQKGVQAFAGALVERVAEQHDWTLDELGDRTVPSAGLEEDGTLPLPCGEDGKPYVGRLDDAFRLIVVNPAGKKISSLPAGTDEVTRASRKRLSAARKELKQVVTLQTARLYEALCAERVWAREDWLRDLAGHPLMRQLIRRVVWIGLDDAGAVRGTFRPTAEGDFTDAADEPIDPSGFGAVRIAHGALLDEADGAAWLAHLADYEVESLLGQFGRTLFRLSDTDEARAATAIEDRKGWLSDSFTIRGAATRLGYERGQPEDAGWFHDYRKPFQSAGLTAVIEFTGSFVPEENIRAALIDLHFERSGRGGRRVALGEVPPVLLSECWNDLHVVAAKAVFDPDWERKSAW